MATLHDRGPSPKRIARVHRTAADRRVVRAHPTDTRRRATEGIRRRDRTIAAERTNRAALDDDPAARDARPVPARYPPVRAMKSGPQFVDSA